MILNRANLSIMTTAFNAAFNSGFAGAESQWNQVATLVPSTSKKEQYGWLNQMPGLREWVGDRQTNSIALSDYSIKNKTWEGTVGVPREDIEDDTYGVYSPLMEEMGRATAAHPDQLVFGLLANGFATTCFDGQYFFDTDHSVLDANGVPQSVSNTGGGGGTAWYLLDTSRALKPLIYQRRKAAQFVAKDKVTDDNVFEKNEFVYGVDGRWNVGFGFWQMAYASKQTLDEASLSAAIAAIKNMKGDYGRPLGLKPTLLVVPPTLETTAEKLLVATYGANGATNVMANKAKVLAPSWLA